MDLITVNVAKLNKHNAPAILVFAAIITAGTSLLKHTTSRHPPGISGAPAATCRETVPPSPNSANPAGGPP